jgi:hypothetical protein
MCNGICASICRVAYTNHGAATRTRIALESPCPVFSLRDDNYRQCNCHDLRALVRRGVRDAIAVLRCKSLANRLQDRGTRSSPLISCMNNSMENAIRNNIAIKRHLHPVLCWSSVLFIINSNGAKPTTRSLCPLYTAQSGFLLRSFDRHHGCYSCCDYTLRYISRSLLVEYFLSRSHVFPLDPLILLERTPVPSTAREIVRPTFWKRFLYLAFSLSWTTVACAFLPAEWPALSSLISLLNTAIKALLRASSII